MATPMAKTQPLVVVEVPKELAAKFVMDEMGMQTGKRPVRRLILRDESGTEIDCGAYQLVSVSTVMTEAAYMVSMATLRAVFD